MNQIGHTINHNLFLSTPSARRATGGAGNAPRDAQFLSTPSARRATAVATGTDPIPWISIHALREEGDNAYVLWQRSDIDFYPRPPRGGRHHPDGNAPVAS